MKCINCKKHTVCLYYYNNDKKAPLCDVCIKEIIDVNMCEGFRLWQQAVDYDQKYHNNAKRRISNLFKEFSACENLPDMAIMVRDGLICQIKAHLQFYNRDCLVALCVLMKQRFLAGMDGASSDFWHSSTEYNVACTIIRYCYEIEEFEGGMLYESEEPGVFDLITAIVFLRILLVLEENIQICERIGYKQRTIQELLYEPIEWKESEKYFEEYVASSRFDKPEDYSFKYHPLELKLRSEHKDMNSIILQADKEIEQSFGFNLDVMMNIMMDPMRKVQDTRKGGHQDLYKIVSVSELYKKFESISDFKTVERILDTFTLRKAPEDFTDLQTRGFYEIRSIVRLGDQVMMTPFDMFQCASVFRGYALSGHNIELYLPNVDTQINLSSVLNITSTFVVYTMVDVLKNSGYTLPQEKKKIDGVLYVVPMAEIKKVMKDGVNLLKQDENLIDIDILACNESSKIIYNIEVKHYKPAVSVKQMLLGDQSKIEGKQTVRKTLARESLIYREQESFLDFLNVRTDEKYTVKSFIVSSRANYYAQLCDSVECITWQKFCERAKNKTL
ncbi:hypothetical protein [Faecalispora anaeroviscerum]|uniref:hypothetical protein n=1 Tax=Faecalispora anaeroviscerum TaxID=2991836 RepID=UPI0024B8C9D6|nr:hypothetical protein [Faecalispora anaeroviscerum]